MPSNGGRSIRERALHSVDDQIGMFDRVIEDTGLERLLEDREAKRLAKNQAGAEYQTAHDAARARLSEEAMEPGDVIRCGRFKIKMTHVEGTAVAFETSDSDRLFINPIE